jgi:integrase/recombinase XerD
MLATYLTTPVTLERYRVGPAGPHLDRFTDWLEVRGYQPDRIQHLLRGVHGFSRWAHSASPPFPVLNATALEAFRHSLHRQQRLHYPSGNYSHLCMGARHFVTFLASTGPSTSLVSIPPAASAPQLFVACCHWRHLHRGTTAATVNNYRLTLLDLLETLGESPAPYTPRALRAFILDRASRHGMARAKTLVTAVRMFLRLLIAGGRCAPGLD